MKLLKVILIALPLILAFGDLSGQQRFPKPEFHREYTQPSPTTPEPRGLGMEFMDVLVLFAVLSLTSWFAIK